jgi:DNA-binding NarL/FixJ family response regulator
MLLSDSTEFTVVAEARGVEQAREVIASTVPDLVVLDLILGSDNGLELLAWLRQRYPQIRTLVLSMQEEALYAERLLRLGASGYLMKSVAATDFLAALRNIAKGQRHLSTAMNERLLSKLARSQVTAAAQDPVTALTERELEVFVLVGMGVSTREIAEQLALSMKTVDAHRRHMRDKLSLRSAGELLRYAAQWTATRRNIDSARIGLAEAC